jgi:hypothetical protein
MRPFLCGAALLLLAACNTDPYHWPGTWDATQSNRVNIITQTANWRDVESGHGDPGADGDEAARAVDRLRHDKVKKLPDIETSDVGVQQGAPAGATQ